MDRRRLAAVLAGFGGALLAIRPNWEAFGWVAILPLASAACHATYLALTKSMVGGRNRVALQFWIGGAASGAFALVVAAGSLVGEPLLSVGVPDAAGWLLFAAMARLDRGSSDDRGGVEHRSRFRSVGDPISRNSRRDVLGFYRLRRAAGSGNVVRRTDYRRGGALRYPPRTRPVANISRLIFSIRASSANRRPPPSSPCPSEPKANRRDKLGIFDFRLRKWSEGRRSRGDTKQA